MRGEGELGAGVLETVGDGTNAEDVEQVGDWWKGNASHF